MSHESVLVTFYKADVGAGSLSVLLTGGIYAYEETGRLGVVAADQTAVYVHGKLQPYMIVKERSNVPTYEISDETDQTTSMRAVIEHYIYADGDDATMKATLATVVARIYRLLQYKVVTNAGRCRLLNELPNLRAQELENAYFRRVDYELTNIITVA